MAKSERHENKLERNSREVWGQGASGELESGKEQRSERSERYKEPRSA